MAKELRCGDIVPDCPTVIEGKDEKEVMAKAGHLSLTVTAIDTASGCGASQALTLTIANVLKVNVPRDFDGDGRTDIAVFRRATGTSTLLQSGTDYTTVPSQE